MRGEHMNGEIRIFTAPDGTAKTGVRVEGETLWLSEQQIASLFERDWTVVGRHNKTIL